MLQNSINQPKWQSQLMWEAIAAQVLSVLQLAGFFKLVGWDFGVVGQVVAGLLSILSLIGIISNPNDGKKL